MALWCEHFSACIWVDTDMKRPKVESICQATNSSSSEDWNVYMYFLSYIEAVELIVNVHIFNAIKYYMCIHKIMSDQFRNMSGQIV